MTHVWNQSINIDEKKAKQLIESQHPIVVKTIHLLDEGCSDKTEIILWEDYLTIL